MSASFNLAFVNDRRELKWFALSATSFAAIAPENIDKHGCNIMVLPATSGLPFVIELPFNDPAKIARVIPQYVADQYAEVKEDWLFSWSLQTAASAEDSAANRQHVVAGIAFPPEFSPASVSADCLWRLAVPDFLLAEVSGKTALKLTSPVTDYIGFFSQATQLTRILADSSLPLPPVLAAAGIDRVTDYRLDNAPAVTHQRLINLMNDSSCYDLSGFRQQQLKSALNFSAAASATLVLGLIFIGHFFLWLECYLTEAAAERTRVSMSKAFSAVFPGVPVVDAVSQTKRKIAEAETSLKEAGSIPNVPWISVFQLSAQALNSKVRLFKLQGRADGFRFQGSAVDYSSLEAFRSAIESSGIVEKVTTPESRKSGDEVLFALEGLWKK